MEQNVGKALATEMDAVALYNNASVRSLTLDFPYIKL